MVVVAVVFAGAGAVEVAGLLRRARPIKNPLCRQPTAHAPRRSKLSGERPKRRKGGRGKRLWQRPTTVAPAKAGAGANRPQTSLRRGCGDRGNPRRRSRPQARRPTRSLRASAITSPQQRNRSHHPPQARPRPCPLLRMLVPRRPKATPLQRRAPLRRRGAARAAATTGRQRQGRAVTLRRTGPSALPRSHPKRSDAPAGAPAQVAPAPALPPPPPTPQLLGPARAPAARYRRRRCRTTIPHQISRRPHRHPKYRRARRQRQRGRGRAVAAMGTCRTGGRRWCRPRAKSTFTTESPGSAGGRSRTPRSQRISRQGSGRRRMPWTTPYNGEGPKW